jgi:hypothetical protein
VIAEATAREFALNLEEALQLVLLYAAYEPAKLERAALRWFRRYLDEGKDVTLLNAQFALSALAALCGPSHGAATSTLSATARTATRHDEDRRVASLTGPASRGTRSSGRRSVRPPRRARAHHERARQARKGSG